MPLYVVLPGDTMWRIAAQHGFASWRELYDMQDAEFKAKHPRPELIWPGDKLYVPEPGIMGKRQRAKLQVATFRAKKPPGVFQQISRQLLSDDLLIKIDHPSKIDQGASSLCGASSILYKIALEEPEKYVKFVTELYDGGKSTLGTLEISPGNDLKVYDPKGQVTPADWVAAASIRDSENWFFDYQSADNEFAGITMPGAMAAWLRKIGFRIVVNETNLLSTKDSKNLWNAALANEKNGYWVFLFVNAQVLYKEDQAKGSVLPNHWIVLLSAIVNENWVKLQVFSWGEKRWIPADGTTLPMATFLKNYYGFVKCKY